MVCRETDEKLLSGILAALGGRGTELFAARLEDQLAAYGASRPFLPFDRFGHDGKQGVMSRQDGGCMIACKPHTDLHEVAAYLTTDPPAYVIGDARTLRKLIPLLQRCQLSMSTGALLRMEKRRLHVLHKRNRPVFSGGEALLGDNPPPLWRAAPCEMHLRAVWDLFCAGFTDFGKRSYETWYVDHSHRIRHHCMTLACFLRGNTCICGCGVSEGSKRLRYLFDLTTRPEFRRQRLAGALLEQVASMDYRPLWLGAQDLALSVYYQRLGFQVCGRWMQIFFSKDETSESEQSQFH